MKKCFTLLLTTFCFLATGFANTSFTAFDNNELNPNDLSYLPVNCQGNILSNPDFQNQNISGWEGAGQYAETGTERYISVCNNDSNARQTRPATSETNYSLTLMARRSSLTAGNIRLKFLSSSWQPIYEEFGSIVGNGGFQPVIINATSPAGTAYIEISIIKRSGPGCVDADDLCLTSDGGGGGDGPDLNLARLSGLTNNADPGDVVNFTFDLINSGDEAVSGDYSIGAYLSNDSNFGNGDVKVGEVNTGNTPIGTIPNVQGAITIPSNQAAGAYFLILKADDGDEIAESNESNNFLSGNIRINGDGGGDGPTVTLTTPSLNVDGPFQVTATYSENVTGFTLAEIQVNNGTKSNPQKISDAVYRWTVNPTISSGNVTVLVLANSANNSAGEGNQESNRLSVSIGDGGDLADLAISNVNLSTYTAMPGDDFGVFIDAASLGAPFDLDITGGYFLTYYLSTDRNLSNNDITIGGALERSLGQQIGIGVALPSTTAPGQYYVIVEAEIRDGSPESDLSNNVAVDDRRITVEERGGGENCGFINTYDIAAESFSPYDAGSFAAGFSFRAITNTAFGLNQDFLRVNIDRKGNLTNSAGEEIPNGVPSKLANYVLQSEQIDDTNYNIKKVGFSGFVSDTRTFTLNPSNPNFRGSIGFFNIIEYPDGSVLAMSVYTDNTNGRQFPFVIKMDASGNELFETEIAEVPNFTSISPVALGKNGDVYVRYNLPGRVGQINKVSGSDGSLLWEGPRVGDLVSSRLNTPVESADGSAVYVPIYGDPFPKIGKYNANTGSEIYLENAATLLESNSDGFFGRNIQLLPTSDNGIIVGYNFDSPVINESGYEYGKIDVNGNKVFSGVFPNLYRLRPVLETETGGYIFTGIREGNVAIVRVTSDGSLDPDCDGGGGDGIDLELGAVSSNNAPPQWSFFSVTFTLTNNGSENESGIKVQVPSRTGVILKGGDEFEASQGTFSPYGNQEWNVGALNAGATATLTLNYFMQTNSTFAIYGQVVAQNGSDVDSAPNNNPTDTPSEDDEAAVIIGPSASARAVFGESRNEYDLENQVRNFKIMKTYPTLTANETRIVLNSKMETEMTIKVYNAAGIEVAQQNVYVVKGVNDIQVEAAEFRSGMYNVLLFPDRGSTRPMMTRFVKQRL